jgi:hypothetical protein
MFSSPSNPYPASIPAPTVSPVCAVSGKNPYLLLLAKTFEFELEQERQLQLKGAGTLPPEWASYLERERQEILDQIQRMELPEEDSISMSDTAQSQVLDPIAHPFVTRALPSAYVPYVDNEVYHGGSIPITVQTRGPGQGPVGPSRSQDSGYPIVLSETKGMLDFFFIPRHT